MADAHGVDPAVKGFVFSIFERADDFGGVLFAETAWCFIRAEVEIGERGFVELEEVEWGLAMIVADECLGDCFANAFDVEGLARAEVRDARDRLGRALEVRAAPCDKSFFLRDGAATRRTATFDMIEERERLRVTVVADDFDHSRDDFAGFFDQHRVADADVFFGDFVLIVQRGARNGRAGDQHRFQLCDRCEHAGAADLDGDCGEGGFLLFGDKLVGRGPARGA